MEDEENNVARNSLKSFLYFIFKKESLFILSYSILILSLPSLPSRYAGRINNNL